MVWIVGREKLLSMDLVLEGVSLFWQVRRSRDLNLRVILPFNEVEFVVESASFG